MTIWTLVLAITGVSGGLGGPAASGSSFPKDEGDLKKYFSKLANYLKRFARKSVEALPAIIDATFSFSKFLLVDFGTYMGFDCLCCRTYWGYG